MSNSNTPPIFKSTEALHQRQRKHSYEPSFSRKQEDSDANNPSHQGIYDDLDVSLLEKKISQTSQLALKDSRLEFGQSPILGGHNLPVPPSLPNSPLLKKKSNFNTTGTVNKMNSPNAPRNQNRDTKTEEVSSKKTYSQKQNVKERGSFQSQQSQQQYRSEARIGSPLNWKEIWLFVKMCLFSYEFNLLDYLRAIDPKRIEEVIDTLKVAPGYKPIQYIYTFYMFKYGILIGGLAAFVYPLPYSILFLMIPVDLNVPFVAIFMLAGMRSGALALLLKYCLHFPKHIFHWIVLIFTVLIGLFLNNNYIFIVLFLISIFLSFYIRDPNGRSSIADSRTSQNSGMGNPSMLNASNFGLNFNEEEIYKEYKVIDNLPQTYPNFSIGVLGASMIFLWVLQRYLENRELTIFGQMLPISLLVNSKQMLAFFPYIYKQTIGTSTLSPNTLISLSFLFPGPHSKPFMFFIVHTQIKNVILGYICLYLPSILLTNVFFGYRPYFYTKTYYNIRHSIQAVGNGIVFCLVCWMLSNEPCFFNSICYSAVVIMVVAKLYKLRELFAITLGIFLISARTLILNINKGISFEDQACLAIPQKL